MLIRFTEDRWLNTEDRTKTPKFQKGSTHDLSAASAFRWVRRDVAVYASDDVVVELPKLKMDRPMMTKDKFTKWADGKPTAGKVRSKPAKGKGGKKP